MKDFMFIIRGGHQKMEDLSPEEKQAHMAEWGAWMGGLAQQEILVGGQPLLTEGKTIVDGGTKVIDRPLTEGKELVGGYIIVKATTLDEATEIAKGCPAVSSGGTMEVREIMILDM